MCRAMPDLQQVRERVQSVIHEVKILEMRISTLPSQQAEHHLKEIVYLLDGLKTLIDVEEYESRERVTIQKFT